MKNRIVKAITTVSAIALLAIALLASINSITVRGYRETDNTAVATKMAAVNGLYEMDSIGIYHIKSVQDYNRVAPILENRDGKLIVEIIDATVLDDQGNGSDAFGFYVEYDTDQFSKGDKVTSVFVYNPDTNYTDDFLYRWDVLTD